MISIDPDITLTTPRLRLRRLTLNDLDAHVALTGDREIPKNASRIPFPYTREAAVELITTKLNAWDRGEEFAFAGFSDDTLAGHAGVRLLPSGWSLGYDVHRDFRGKGYATELAFAVCSFAFSQLDAEEIHAGHYVDNPSSGSVLKKLGFQETGKRVSVFSKGRGCKVESIDYLMRKTDFRQDILSMDIDQPG